MRRLTLALAVCALAPAQQIHTHTLANGMKLIVQEDHAIPNVALYTFFRVGSRNERTGTTGISHFFEHMMFNGAKKYGPKQFDVQMEKNGGSNNAYTDRDITAYSDWFPSGALELMFDMEADRIRDLAFDPKIIASERDVVYSERRLSVDNSNNGALYEQGVATAIQAHPYHWPIIGWASDIESWTMDDLRSHFAMGYAPNNATVVVVGDVQTPRVLELAKKYLEPIPRHEPPPPVRTKEPEQKGERRVTLRRPAQLPLQMFFYHVAETKSPDAVPLDALQAILTQGQSSRLYKRMVDQDQIAISVTASDPDSIDPYLFSFTVEPRSGVDLARTEKALYDEIERLQKSEVPAAELRKAKNQLLMNHYGRMKTIAGRADMLGHFEIFFGDYARALTHDQAIEAVTAADVLRVARKYFTPENRTVATLIPLAEEETKP